MPLEYPDFSRQISGRLQGRFPLYRMRACPTLQNGPASLIRGAKRAIQHVGISNFRLPVRFRTKDGRREACSIVRSRGL